jgi:hypothetical protein
MHGPLNPGRAVGIGMPEAEAVPSPRWAGRLAGVPLGVSATLEQETLPYSAGLQQALAEASGDRPPLLRRRPTYVTAGKDAAPPAPQQQRAPSAGEARKKGDGRRVVNLLAHPGAGRLSGASRASPERDEAHPQRSGRDAKSRAAVFLRKLLGRRPDRRFDVQRRASTQPAATDGRYRRLFPLRDQDNPLHVLPDLADPADRSRVDPRIRLLGLDIGAECAALIRHDIEAGLFPDVAAGDRALSWAQREAVDESYGRLIRNLRLSLERAMNGEEPVPPGEVYVRTLAARDLAPGEEALLGQYGLFNRRNAEGKWRSIAEGQHLCFFAGFYCRGAAEYERECERHGRDNVDAYALVVGDGDYPCLFPFQGGDLGQFANSAIVEEAGGNIVEDEARTNTRFARADLTFEDNRPGKDGTRIVLPLVFLYMLAPFASDACVEREARVWYGRQYWEC